MHEARFRQKVRTFFHREQALVSPEESQGDPDVPLRAVVVGPQTRA